MRKPDSARSVFCDAVAIIIIGTAIGLVANALSPRGLSLARDYFPGGAPPTGNAAGRDATGHDYPPLVQRQAAAPAPQPGTTKRGLRLVSHDDAVRLFHDPRFATGLVIFVDARSEDRYAAGHIPGAYPFDHYRPAHTLARVLAAAQIAQRIIVYCHGGDCEDSELAALDLISAGIPAGQLAIYGGGITEWQQRGLPVERGTHER